MSNPTCNRTTLVENFPCHREKLSTRQLLLLKIYANILELAALGGTDYRTTLASTLISDSVTYRTLNKHERLVAFYGINFNNAVAAGSVLATQNTDIQLLNMACVQNYPDLESILINLQCQLGVHKTFPQ